MADMSNKYHEWERQWRDAFDGAEVPSGISRMEKHRA